MRMTANFLMQTFAIGSWIFPNVSAGWQFEWAFQVVGNYRARVFITASTTRKSLSLKHGIRQLKSPEKVCLELAALFIAL
jgi:hypothetical protein